MVPDASAINFPYIAAVFVGYNTHVVSPRTPGTRLPGRMDQNNAGVYLHQWGHFKTRVNSKEGVVALQEQIQ